MARVYAGGVVLNVPVQPPHGRDAGWLLSELFVSWLGLEGGSCQSWRGFTRDTSLLKWLVPPTSQSCLLVSLILGHL